MSTYLLVNLLAIAIPIVLSFDKKVHFVSRWKHLFPALIITSAVFIAWDVIFTHLGVWGFNSRHLTGINILNLPVEEWLFFLTIPYASIFTYEVFIAYITKDILAPYSKAISIILIILLFSFALVYNSRLYTVITFSVAAVWIMILQFVLKVRYLGRFYFSFLIILFPFMIVNGILTGSFIEEEVVWYNNSENMGIRFFTIPLEDTIYGLLLILMNISIYEKLKRA